MRYLVSGASGFVGQALVKRLQGNGHEVVRLVRRRAGTSDGEAAWAPARGELDPAVLDGVDAVVNLNGRSIADGRWTDEVRAELRSSRLDSTMTLVRAFRKADRPPKALLNASAIGFYGDRDDEVLDESSSAGEGFLAELARDWESAAAEAAEAGVRVVTLRLGMVVGKGGAVAKMLLPFKLGAGGPIGNGRQWWSWIALDDVAGSIEFLAENDAVSGPVNLVSPAAERCKDFSKVLGKVLRRPAFMPLPAFAARLALGDMADALLLASTRVKPSVLENAGYRYEAGDLEEALKRSV
jgi:uncharacterized protein (TIGR01777 family)